MAKAPKTQENSGNPRIVSLQQAALLLDRDRNTIAKWIAQGCPVTSTADKFLGKSWELDISQVVRWLEDRAAESVATLPADGESKEEAERRLKWAQAKREELRLKEEAASVARIDDIADLVASEYAQVRASLQAIPAKLATRLVGQTDPNLIQAEVEGSIRYALESLRHDQPAA